MQDEALEFLSALRPNGPWTLSAIAAGKVPTRTCRTLSEAGDFIAQYGDGANLHYQPNPTKPVSRKAALADLTALEFAHVDIDRDAGGARLTSKKQKAAVIAALRKHSPPPSFIIDSGNGIQALWRFLIPLAMAEAEALTAINRRFAATFGGDAVPSPAQLLRLPGTINRPDEKKRKAGLVEVEALLIEVNEGAWEPDDFPRAIAPAPAATATTTLPPAMDVESLDILDEWRVPAKIREIIEHGHDLDNPGTKSSRSEWRMHVAVALAGCSVPAGIMQGILINPDFVISDGIHDVRGRTAEQQAAREVEKALRFVATRDWKGRTVPNIPNVEPCTELELTARRFGYSYAETLAWGKAIWLIENYLPERGMVQLYGKQKDGKSYVMLDMALCVAMGRLWHGHEVRRSKVVYVAAEGSRARFRDRVTAWLLINEVSADDLDGFFYIVPRPVNLTHGPTLKEFVAWIVTECEAEGALVIFDTLTKNSAGADEDTEGMKRVCAGAAYVQERTGGCVALIHHQGKDASKGSRGSTVLPGEVDVTMHLQRDAAGKCRLKVEESRDGESGICRDFEFKKVVVDLDDMAESSSIIPASTDAVPEKLYFPEGLARQVLAAIVKHRGNPMTAAELARLLDCDSKRRRAVYKAVDELRTHGLLRPKGAERIEKIIVTEQGVMDAETLKIG